MTTSTCAMDAIEVRPMRFKYEDIAHRDPVWSQSQPLFAIFINGLAVHSPYFERFLCTVCRKAKPAIDDARLSVDLAALIGQEAHHAFNFLGMNRFLASRYPKVVDYDRDAREYFEAALRDRSFKSQLAFVAGYETFTYLAGMIVLDRYEQFMGRADPVMRALWVWHQVEEVEHGAVAFDVYRALFGRFEWFRKWMLLRAFAYVSSQALYGYMHMCSREGYFKHPRRALQAGWFFLWLCTKLVVNAAPALRADYHPRKHPRCEREQSPIAVAWRKHYARGADVSTLDDVVMQTLTTNGAHA
jgi:predicted metal-dependent hydrolase